MKTKEEILISKLPQQFQYGWFGSNPPIEWEKAIEAMEDYAQMKVNELSKANVSGNEANPTSIIKKDGEVALAKYDQIKKEAQEYTKNIKEQTAFIDGAIWIKSELLKYFANDR